MNKRKKRSGRTIELIKAIWSDTYCIIIPCAISCAYFYAYWKNRFNFFASENFIDLLQAILTAVTILTGFMAALLGAIVQGRDTSPTILRFFEVIGDKGEKRFIRLLRHSMLGGFVLLALTGFLFLSDVLTKVDIYCSFLWVWLLVYFGASTYRFIALFLSLLLTKLRSAERAVRKHHTDDEKARFEEHLRRQCRNSNEDEPKR